MLDVPTNATTLTMLIRSQWNAISVALSIPAISREERRQRIEAHIERECNLVNLSQDPYPLFDLLIRYAKQNLTPHNLDMIEDMVVLYPEDGRSKKWEKRMQLSLLLGKPNGRDCSVDRTRSDRDRSRCRDTRTLLHSEAEKQEDRHDHVKILGINKMIAGPVSQ